MGVKPFTLFTGDNLPIMRGMEDSIFDLIYLDPPFNKNKDFVSPIGSIAEGTGFKDWWVMDDVKAEEIGEIAERSPAAADLINLAGEIGKKGSQAYLIVMSIRLLEIKRLLKDTGSVFLHCDTAMSHWLKLLMDSIFGKDEFCSEISWERTEAQKVGKRFGANHDNILFYGKTKKRKWMDLRKPIPEDAKPSREYKPDENGRYFRKIDVVALPGHGGTSPRYEYKGFTPKTRWLMTEDKLRKLDEQGLLVFSRSGRPYRKQYWDNHPGTPYPDIWYDIGGGGHLSGSQRLGFKTQKPIELLSRIIEATTDEGDIVLDPFCGCATTLIAAQKLGREWVGIDQSPAAVKLIEVRMQQGELGSDFIVRTDIPKREKDSVKSPDIKNILYGKQKGYCNLCRIHFRYANLTIDHILPSTHGGGEEDDNKQLLCGFCNSVKGSKRTMAEAKARLKELGMIQ